MRTMSLDQIRTVAPSVFSTKPYAAMSEKYRFFETSHVVEALMQEGFAVVRAQQSRSRIEGKQDFTKHLLYVNVHTAKNPNGEIRGQIG